LSVNALTGLAKAEGPRQRIVPNYWGAFIGLADGDNQPTIAVLGGLFDPNCLTGAHFLCVD
jgi:hypothetical protein